MASTLDYTVIDIDTLTATSATGYSVDNLASERIAKQWRSAGTGAQEIKVDLGSVQTVDAVWLTDANMSTVAVTYSTGDVSYATAGTMTLAADQIERKKGRVAVGQDCRYLKLAWASGAPTAGYWFAGSLYVFGDTETLNPCFSWGWHLAHVAPGRVVELANGRSIKVSAGTAFTTIEADMDDDWQTANAWSVRNKALAGVVGLDLGLDDHAGFLWPVINVEEEVTQTRDHIAPLTMKFIEVV